MQSNNDIKLNINICNLNDKCVIYDFISGLKLIYGFKFSPNVFDSKNIQNIIETNIIENVILPDTDKFQKIEVPIITINNLIDYLCKGGYVLNKNEIKNVLELLTMGEINLCIQLLYNCDLYKSFYAISLPYIKWPISRMILRFICAIRYIKV